LVVFRCGKEQKEKLSAQGTSCKNKTQEDGAAIVTGGREREEYDIQNGERSSGGNRHVISGCWGSGGNECEAYRKGLGEPQKAYVYTVHIHIEGGKSVKS